MGVGLVGKKNFHTQTHTRHANWLSHASQHARGETKNHGKNTTSMTWVILTVTYWWSCLIKGTHCNLEASTFVHQPVLCTTTHSFYSPDSEALCRADSIFIPEISHCPLFPLLMFFISYKRLEIKGHRLLRSLSKPTVITTPSFNTHQSGRDR